MSDKVFTYGTLNDPAKQQELFGRRVVGAPDALDGYAKAELVEDGETFFIAHPSATGSIEGQVLELAAADLEAADRWEGEAYERVRLRLRSGTQAWVYVKKGRG